MYMYIHLCMYSYIHACIHIPTARQDHGIYVHVHICMYTYIHAKINIPTARQETQSDCAAAWQARPQSRKCSPVLSSA